MKMMVKTKRLRFVRKKEYAADKNDVEIKYRFIKRPRVCLLEMTTDEQITEATRWLLVCKDTCSIVKEFMQQYGIKAFNR